MLATCVIVVAAVVVCHHGVGIGSLDCCCCDSITMAAVLYLQLDSVQFASIAELLNTALVSASCACVCVLLPLSHSVPSRSRFNVFSTTFCSPARSQLIARDTIAKHLLSLLAASSVAMTSILLQQFTDLSYVQNSTTWTQVSSHHTAQAQAQTDRKQAQKPQCCLLMM